MTRRLSSPWSQFAVALGILVLTVAGYGAWYARVSSLSARAASLDEEIRTESEATLRLASARATLTELSGDERAVRAYFVSEDQVVAFIDTLESIGKALGATVAVASVSTASTGEHPTLSITLSASGTFDAVMRTEGAIEFAPYDLTVSSLSVRRGTKDEWIADLTVSVGSVAAPGAAKPLRAPSSVSYVLTASRFL